MPIEIITDKDDRWNSLVKIDCETLHEVRRKFISN